MNTSEHLHQILKALKKERMPEIERSAEGGDAEAQLTMGVAYANGKGVKHDAARAAHWLEQAAGQGKRTAQTLLGWMYTQGEGVAGDAGKALHWYRLAAESGDADAQCALADLFLSGASGLPPQPDRSVQWYASAARQDHPKAQYMLGKLLAEGSVVEADEEAAFRWLTFAILNGSEPAQRELQILTGRLDPATVEEFKQRLTGETGALH